MTDGINIELLKRTMKYHGWTNQKLANAIGMSRDTLQRRFRDQTMRLIDIKKMMQVIPLTYEEVGAIFFNKK